MRQQYDKMNQSILSNSLRSVFVAGTSPHTKCRMLRMIAIAIHNHQSPENGSQSEKKPEMRARRVVKCPRYRCLRQQKSSERSYDDQSSVRESRGTVSYYADVGISVGMGS